MKKIFLFLLASISVFAQKPIFTTAKVKAVTVYFNSAEIMQTTSVNLPKGNSEIVIKNVANYLNENTIQIGAPATVTVLSVQFSDNYMSEFEVDLSNPELKKVRDSIKIVEKDIQKTENARDSEAKLLDLLDKNQQVSGLNVGLNVNELMKMVEYYRPKRTEISNNYDALDDKAKKLQLQLANLKAKLETNTANDDKTSKGKLIIQVMNSEAALVDLNLNYITPTANWQPFYDLRANSIADPINMVYKAKVTQTSGIDWKKIKLTLSSGNPNQDNQAPILNAWWLNYQQNVAYGYSNQALMKNQIQGRAAGVQVMATEAMADQESTVSDFTNIQENQLNISFDIDIPYDILSNGKEHAVALKEIQLPAHYKYYAVPRIEKEAFLLAEINDYSKYNLLQGEANIIFEGLYVGKTFINPNQTTDTLSLSMGRDKKISIKREKIVDKSGTKFLSSKKEQTFTFDITVRNNKKEAVDMLLKDQYPLSPDKDIEVELLESSGASNNTESGILTWNLNLKPNETQKIRISYKVRYPKDKIIGNL